MVYARRRNTKTYSKKRYVPRPSRILTARDYVPVEAGFVRITNDQANNAFDIFTDMVLQSQDWATLVQTFSEFKMTSVEVTHVPFNLNTTTASDIACGLMAIREGFYEAAPVALAPNLLTKYRHCVPLVNIRSAKIAMSVSSGEWFHANAVQSADSDAPKLTCMFAYSSVANTNTNKGFLMFKCKFLARGRINL